MSLKGPFLSAPLPAPAAPLLPPARPDVSAARVSDFPCVKIESPSVSPRRGEVVVVKRARPSCEPERPAQEQKRQRPQTEPPKQTAESTPVSSAPSSSSSSSLRRLPWVRPSPVPDRPIPHPDAETTDGEGPWDRFLPEPSSAPSSALAPASSFSSLAWQANRFTEDPQYLDEGPGPPERSPTEPVPFAAPSGSGLFVAALGDHCADFQLPAGRLEKRGYLGPVDGIDVPDGELIGVGATQLTRTLLQEAAPFFCKTSLGGPALL